MGNRQSEKKSPEEDKKSTDDDKSITVNSESREPNELAETVCSKIQDDFDKRLPSSNLPRAEEQSATSSEEDYEEAEEIEKESEKKFLEYKIASDDEKAKLLQKISELESELQRKVSRLDEDMKQSRDDLQVEHSLLLEHHAQLVSRDIKQRILISNLKNENEKLRNSSDLEIQVKQLSNQVAMDEQLVMKLETELKDLRLENERLANQLVSTKERVAGDSQEILQQGGKLSGKLSSKIQIPPPAEAAQVFEHQNINRRSKKRKIENLYDIDDIDGEEVEAREKMLQTESSSHDAECKELCCKMSERCALNPVKLNLSYGTDLFQKQLIIVIDSNVVINFMDLLSDLLSCKIDGNFPIIYIPYIVVKELDSIRKDNRNMNPELSRRCNRAMAQLEQCTRESSRILEQTLKEMKIASVIEFKNKDADDRITECCLSLKKSAKNILLWTEDLNLRLKVLGHLVPAVKHTEILKIIQHGSKNPLRKRMLKEENLVLVSEILAQCSADLILDILSDPKNAILLLTENHQNLPSVSESETEEFEETISRTRSLGNLNLDRLFQTE